MPEPSLRALRALLRFALVMLVVSLLAGISFQESTKKLSPMMDAGVHLAARIDLALVHGHTFVLGVLLPLALAGMLHMGQALGFTPVHRRWLDWGVPLLIVGTALSVVLMLAKGYHVVLGVRHGGDVQLLREAFMGGHGALRSALYGASHSLMGLGAGLLGLGFWRSMGRPSTR